MATMLGQGLMKQMGWIYRPAEEVEEWKAKDPYPGLKRSCGTRCT